MERPRQHRTVRSERVSARPAKPDINDHVERVIARVRSYKPKRYGKRSNRMGDKPGFEVVAPEKVRHNRSHSCTADRRCELRCLRC